MYPDADQIVPLIQLGDIIAFELDELVRYRRTFTVERLGDDGVHVARCVRGTNGEVTSYESCYTTLENEEFECSPTVIIMRPDGTNPPRPVFVRIDGELTIGLPEATHHRQRALDCHESK